MKKIVFLLTATFIFTLNTFSQQTQDEYKMINETGEKVDYAGLEAILAAIDTARTRLNANVNMELAMELLLLTMKHPS